MFYKLIICGERLYQEITLSDETLGFKIGTGKSCRIRINRALAPTDFELDVYRSGGIWRVKGDSNTSFVSRTGAVGSDIAFEIGNRLGIHIGGARHELFGIELYVDFPIKNENYDMKIAYSGFQEISIGGMGCNIQISDSDAVSEQFVISNNMGNLIIRTISSRFGISVNGIPCNSSYVEVKNKDFFSICGYQFFVFNGDLYTTTGGKISASIPSIVIEYQKNHFTYPKFIKNTRQMYLTPTTEIEILDPKTKPTKPEPNLIRTMIPSLISIVLIVLLRGSMSGSGNSFIYYSVAMMSVGMIGSIITYFHDGKKYVKDMAEREVKYREYLAEQEEKIQNLRNKEHEIACLQSATVLEDIERIAEFDSRLFEKKKEHEDYLCVNLGKGVVPTKCSVGYKPQEYVDTDDYLMDYPRSIHDKYELIEDMPVNIDLKKSNAIGFIGNRNKLYQMVKNITVNIATEHFYQDVKMFYILEEKDVPQFEWARWLQNSIMGNNIIRNFMYDEESAKIVLEYLYEELSFRDGLKENETKGMQNIVVFVYRSHKISNHPIMQYVEHAAKLGFCFIFMEEYPELLNEYCQQRIFLRDDANMGVIQEAADGEHTQRFEYEHIPRDIVEQAALKLACVYVDEYSLESSLTKNISLFELLEIGSANDIDLENRWSTSKIFESMAAPLGVKNGGEVVSLDLHEKYHGPHGLVAGTTGSGKSEILQSYILSMATLFHPYEVGFIIIDFKGGGMVNQFKNLPHLNGAITNIDGREINRSLLSIRAELRKRQELFAEAEVNHIDEYIKAFKRGDATIPLPHLILIVDEFAELKSEQPDFMKELISTARIGRSLGVHLILATQKPSGVVNDQIWSNSKFKLCLKVQNKQDSNEVLKSPLAAEIREPGRAYLQVGNNEIFQLFQSAYSGGPAKSNVLGAKKKYKLSKVLLSGQREVFFEQKIQSAEEGETQLDALVKHIDEYFGTTGLERLPNICLPPLASVINHTHDNYTFEPDVIDVPIGIYDDPNRQSQDVTGINLTLNNLFLLGSSQMGKTNMLQMIIKGIASKYSPDDVNIYILDFATMVLKNFDSLKHVGGVATSGDDEKIQNLFKILLREIDTRKKTLSKMGLSSYAAYREAGYRELPQIILMLDNVTAFKEMVSEDIEESLSTICRDGLSLGITIIATNTVSSGMGLRFLSYFSAKVAFTCNSNSEYSSIFERCKIEPAEIPGRAIVRIDKEYYECQTYLAFEGEKEIDRTKRMKEFIEEINDKYKECEGAERIPYIPEQFDAKYLDSLVPDNGADYQIAVGIDYENTKPATVDFRRHPQIGFYGRSGLGKKNLICHILATFENNKESYPYELYIADNREKEFAEYSDMPQTTSYGVGDDVAMEFVKEIHNRLEQRDEDLEKESFIILLLNSKDQCEAISDDYEVNEMYDEIIKKYGHLKICVLITDLENDSIGFGSNDVIKHFRDDKIFFLFDDVDNLEVIDVPLSVRRTYSKKLEKGEAYRVVNNDLTKMKIPMY